MPDGIATAARIRENREPRSDGHTVCRKSLLLRRRSAWPNNEIAEPRLTSQLVDSLISEKDGISEANRITTSDDRPTKW